MPSANMPLARLSYLIMQGDYTSYGSWSGKARSASRQIPALRQDMGRVVAFWRQGCAPIEITRNLTWDEINLVWIGR